MRIAVYSNRASLEDVLPGLAGSVHELRRHDLASLAADYPVAVVDTAVGLREARDLCSHLARGSLTPVLAVVDEGSLVTVDDRWGPVDILLRSASPAEVEFRLRMASARRRRATKRTGRQVLGPLIVDRERRTASLDGRRLVLPGRAFDLLASLSSPAGRVRTRDELLEQVWGSHWRDPSTVAVHISRLRLALGRSADAIVTVRGAGYLLDADRLALEP